MPARRKHYDNIINAAVTLFRRKGYSGTGVADIAELADAPKGSLYHFFPAGKSSIAQAAVAETGRRVVDTLRRLDAEAASAADLIAAHARKLAAWMAKSRYRDGCPMTTVLLELCPEHSAVTATGREAYALRNRMLAARLVADGFDAARAERLAVLCTAALQGALIQVRVEKSQAPLLEAADELAILLKQATRQRTKPN